jgi:hypothetical protein
MYPRPAFEGWTPSPIRNAVARPLLERRDEGVLRDLLGQPDVTQQARERGDETRALDPPDRLDRAPRVH